ncbi:protein ANTI-SILENCING 1 isoform X2 [Morus notabilis]|uniref:protein ANTI-SILENCING 1 isoform X2 n=1 Tax=Morus notabilis TaxID=981085 RepID=UPI000CED0F8D|nr:protein ANTI-SILENCING 1 isoform X2 [Morus notabilis]
MVEVEPEKVEDAEFEWGKKKGIGGKKKRVQFYESFTYDGVEYVLFDSVYLYKEGEPEPYIGKLLKIWEHPDKMRKVKVLWFFRPCEILNFLGDEEPSDNELFLASGEGVGLCNVNPLEAIAGKCNVVCISKDNRNRQPTDKELQTADYVFRRTFDVGNRKILDEIEETIAGTDVKSLLNREDFEKSAGTLKVDSGGKEVGGTAAQTDDTVVSSETNSSKKCPVVDTNGHCSVTLPNEAVETNVLFTKHESSTAEKTASGVSVESDDVAKTNQTKENVRDHKALSGSKVEPKHSEAKVGKVLAGQVESERKVECAKDSVELDDRPSKKAKLSSEYVEKSKNSMQQSRFKYDANDGETLALTASALKPSKDSTEKGPSKKLKPEEKTTMLSSEYVEKSKNNTQDGETLALTASSLKPSKDFIEKGLSKKLKPEEKTTMLSPEYVEKSKNSMQQPRFKSAANDGETSLTVSALKPSKDSTEKGPSKKLKPEEKTTMLSNGKLIKEPSQKSHNEDHKTDGQKLEERRKWFPGLPWEDSMRTAYEQSRLVLLQNLDPSYTSAEVEDIVWHGFGERCTVKMIQRIVFSSPHSGQAFVIFSKREVAEMVVRKLDESCLLLSDGRPLVGSLGTPCFPEKKPKFFGHFGIDKRRYQMQREEKDAVSTSHCSQPNTLEFEMALEWCLLQEKSELSWKKLYQKQGQELKQLKVKLKARWR